MSMEEEGQLMSGLSSPFRMFFARRHPLVTLSVPYLLFLFSVLATATAFGSTELQMEGARCTSRKLRPGIRRMLKPGIT